MKKKIRNFWKIFGLFMIAIGITGLMRITADAITGLGMDYVTLFACMYMIAYTLEQRQLEKITDKIETLEKKNEKEN